MKKYSTAILLCTVLAIMVSGNYVFTSRNVRAVESAKIMEPSVPAEGMPVPPESTNGGAMKEKSEYVLPYPGILPDHPLYFLKDFRDKIIEMLIVDSARKSEFYLLQSDKFLSATQSLLDKNQKEKAATILAKSSERMTMAVSELSTMKTGDRQVPAGSIDRLEKSIEKHTEVLGEISSMIDTVDALTVLQKAEAEIAKLK